VTTHPVLGGRWWTPVDSDQQVDAASVEAMRVPLCLRDEEANAIGQVHRIDLPGGGSMIRCL